MVQNLNRTPEAMKAGGFRTKSEFYAAISGGRFPKPDAYVGARSPVWLDETLAQHQRDLIAAASASETFAKNSASASARRALRKTVAKPEATAA